jgi:pyridoxamine 5'-phosphate oxidase
MDANVTHEELFEKVLSTLENAVVNRHDAFHTATLATVNLKGEPEARTVVFRRLLRQPLALCCHIDLRSPKADEIRNNPNVSWMFYGAAEKLQLRIRAAAALHTDDALAEEQWQSSKLFARRCYCGDAPGTLKDFPSSGLPDFLTSRAPTEEETNEMGRQNFCVVRSVVREIDVYELCAQGHRRSLFIIDENGEIEPRWLTP